MRILVLDSALAHRLAAVVEFDLVLAVRSEAAPQGHQPAHQPGHHPGHQPGGHEAVLPVMARAVLEEAGGAIDLIGVTVGPGSFTGIRSGLALAHGIGLGRGVPVIGVTTGEAFANAFPHLGSRELWTVSPARRGYFFQERAGIATSIAYDALTVPAYRVAIAGPAANEIAARLAARGADVLLTDARAPQARHIAHVAFQRARGALPPIPAQPIYVDAPDARLPAGGLRPPPVPASGGAAGA